MTKSNITREHEGKHGVLTLGGSRNKGTVESVDSGWVLFKIDGANSRSLYKFADGWQFTPDPDPLPTEPGWYVCTSETSGESVPTLYYLSDYGDWYQTYGHVTCSLLRNTVAGLHARDPLIRVSFGVAS